ncbi:MAG: hypothetical protein ACK56I_32000, partial [bacterium]
VHQLARNMARHILATAALHENHIPRLQIFKNRHAPAYIRRADRTVPLQHPRAGDFAHELQVGFCPVPCAGFAVDADNQFADGLHRLLPRIIPDLLRKELHIGFFRCVSPGAGGVARQREQVNGGEIARI